MGHVVRITNRIGSESIRIMRRRIWFYLDNIRILIRTVNQFDFLH